MAEREQSIVGAAGGTTLATPPQAQERRVTEQDVHGSTAKAPDLSEAPEPEPIPSVAVPEGAPRLSSLLRADEEDEDDEPVGFGPRLIVLHDFVKGHTKGAVVWATDLVGVESWNKANDGDKKAQKYIREELQRLLDLKAVREATSVEGQYERVTFVTGEKALATEVEKSQKLIASKDEEIAALQKKLEEAQQRAEGGGEFSETDDEADAPKF